MKARDVQTCIRDAVAAEIRQMKREHERDPVRRIRKLLGHLAKDIIEIDATITTAMRGLKGA